MKCYALGALELFDDIYDIDTVSMTIYQPRRQNISSYEVSKDDLYQWADEVLKPTADLAFASDPYLLFLYLRRLFVTEILKDRTILHTLAASL